MIYHIDFQAVRQNFRVFVKEVEEIKVFPHEWMDVFANNYDVEEMNLDQLSSEEALKAHEEILVKYQNRQLKKVWCEGETRLFMWMLAYLEVILRKKGWEFEESDWETLTLCLPRKTTEDARFEFRMLSKTQQNEQWEEEELKLLNDIIREQKLQNKWNQVSKQLFKLSQQKHFRKPKQCREQWKNHLDPDIEKGEWTLDDDYELLELVLDIGKKWSSISKCIGKRTEHAVKNRFHSLIRQHAKVSKKNSKTKATGKRKDQEEELISYIMKSMKETEGQEQEEVKPAPKKKRLAPKNDKLIEPRIEPPTQESKPLFQNPAPVIQQNTLKQIFGRDDIGDRFGYVYSPLTPYTAYVQKNKHLGNLLLVTSPRIISPRFKMINQWEDLDNKEYFL